MQILLKYLESLSANFSTKKIVRNCFSHLLKFTGKNPINFSYNKLPILTLEGGMITVLRMIEYSRNNKDNIYA